VLSGGCFWAEEKKEINERACRFEYRSLLWSFNKERKAFSWKVWMRYEQSEVCGGIPANKVAERTQRLLISPCIFCERDPAYDKLQKFLTEVGQKDRWLQFLQYPL
jgi:hypothetical protein